MKEKEAEKEIDITKHNLVPKHIKISEEEKQELLKTYNISSKQLPVILENDAAIKNLDFEIGDVIKIIRKSPTNKESIFYRLVINS